MNCALPLICSEEKNGFAFPLLDGVADAKISFPLFEEMISTKISFPLQISHVENTTAKLLQLSILFHNLTIGLSASSGEITVGEVNDVTLEVV